MDYKKFLRGQKIFYLYIGLAVLLLFSFSVLLVDKINTRPRAQIISEQMDKPIISQDTKITREVGYLCGDKLAGMIPADELQGLDYKALRNRFPESEGWQIDDSVTNTVKLTKNEKQLCPIHRNYRHFGINNDNLAVYEGPLGFQEKMLSEEQIKTSNLPQEIQDKLKKVVNYNSIPDEVQGELKRELEFNSEYTLNQALEGLSEYSR